jgi:hypothetical protein
MIKNPILIFIRNILDMRPALVFILSLICLFPVRSIAQNGPVTTAPHVLSPGPDVTVPITVSNFTDIGAISLTLDFDISIVAVSAVTANTALTVFSSYWTSTSGRLVMAWYGITGMTFPDNTVLVTIEFTNLTHGSTALTWFDDGISCEYAKYNNGTYTVLDDTPTGDFYKNGSITWQRPAPVTIAPIYPATVGDYICVPFRVVGFTDIGSISLTLDYDPSVLEFQGISSYSIPRSWLFDGQATTPGRLIVGGYGSSLSLPDTSDLFEACFIFQGGTSPLSWFDADGSSCEYADAASWYPLYDLPQPDFYIDGLVSDAFVADFMADNTTPPRNTTVQLTDLSQIGAIGWEWTFDRPTVIFMNGTDHHSQNPQVQFTDGGLYTVTLVAHNALFTDSETKIEYIRAGVPGIWTGETTTEWMTETNWDNHLVPDNLIDVFIPASCPNWPVFNGDFVIGIHCKTITLMNVTSRMTVTGDFSVN